MTRTCQTPRRRHPASGYVQGINDLVTPFLAVFLGEHFTREQPMAHWDIASIAEETMLEVHDSKGLNPESQTVYVGAVHGTLGHRQRCGGIIFQEM